MMIELAVALLAVGAAVIILVTSSKKTEPLPVDLPTLPESTTEETQENTEAETETTTAEPETATASPETTTTEPEPTETTTEQETDENGNPVISFTITTAGDQESTTAQTEAPPEESGSDPAASGDGDQTESESESLSESEAGDGSDSDSESADESGSEDGSGSESETESDSETETESDSDSDSESNSESETESDSESDSESETESTEKTGESADYSQVVFIGDSRTLTMGTGGEYAFDLVPMDSIAATWGGQLIDNSAYENITAAAGMARKKAVFWYGINDVQLNAERDNPEVFIANYDRLISTYLTMNDSSTIYILSILPTTDQEKDYYEGQNENIAAYNQALQNYANEHNYVFLDLSPLFTGNECFAEGDNIHFAEWWYKERFLPAVTRAVGIVY